MKTVYTFYSEAFKIALQAITSHKLRAFLTLIGIIIGVASVIAEKFVPGLDPIGRAIKIAGYPLRIIGMEEKRGSMFGNSLDNLVYVPITTWGHMFGRLSSIQVHGKATARELFDKTLDQGEMSMRIKHKLKGNQENDFGGVNVQQV